MHGEFQHPPSILAVDLALLCQLHLQQSNAALQFLELVLAGRGNLECLQGLAFTPGGELGAFAIQLLEFGLQGGDGILVVHIGLFGLQALIGEAWQQS